MTRGWLSGGLGQAILCGIVAAGIVNIVATFATPVLVQPRAFDRVAEHLPVNQLVVLPQTGPQSQLLPYQQPDMQLAICNYDLSGGGVRARVVLPSSGWTLALYTPDGDNFYVLPGRDQRTTTVDALLVPAGGDLLVGLDRPTGGGPAPTYIQVPETTGLLMLRAPIKGESYRAEIAETLARASCGREKARVSAE